MPKVMSNSDVLRCLAKNIIYRPVEVGKHQADVSCDDRCVKFAKEDLCKAFREVINDK